MLNYGNGAVTARFFSFDAINYFITFFVCVKELRYEYDVMNLVLTRIRCIIIRITGNKSTSVQRPAQHKLNFRDPFFNGFRLGLFTFCVWFEVVGEIAIQIETAGIISKNMNFIMFFFLD